MNTSTGPVRPVIADNRLVQGALAVIKVQPPLDEQAADDPAVQRLADTYPNAEIILMGVEEPLTLSRGWSDHPRWMRPGQPDWSRLMGQAVPVSGGATMAVPPYVEGSDGTGRRPQPVDAARLWTGGLATALVAALVAVVGVLIARGLFDIPVLAPAREGALGDSTTARLAILAAAAALAATGLMHLLLLSTPRPFRFFTWITSLLTIVAVLAPFMTDAKLDTQVATATIALVIGMAIGSLVSGAARSAIRLSRQDPRLRER